MSWRHRAEAPPRIGDGPIASWLENDRGRGGAAGGALQLAQQVRYDAYGTHRLYDAAGDLLGDENTPSAITPLLYQGQRFDAESGTYCFGARTYNPHTGRFTAQDPMGVADGPNPYAFLGNSPLSNLDPTGMFRWRADAWDRGIGMAAGYVDSFFGMVTLGMWHPMKDVMGALDPSGKWCQGYKEGKELMDYMAMAVPIAGAEVLLFKAAGAVARWASKLKAVLKVKSCLQMSSNPILRRIQKFLNPRVACFLAGTPVWVLQDGIDPEEANAALADGADYRDYATTRPIEAIVVGDYALSRPDTDPDGLLSFERVVALHINERVGVEHVTVRDEATGAVETLHCTPHLFYARLATRIEDVGQWTLTSDLDGDCVIATTNGNRYVTVVSKSESKNSTRTYNLSVAIGHTCFVGETACWAHNTPPNYGTLFGRSGSVHGAGCSTALGQNWMASRGLPTNTRWSGHQAHHTLRVELRDHPALRAAGLRIDDARNARMLRTPDDLVSTATRHRGSHEGYTNAIRGQLDAVDLTQGLAGIRRDVELIRRQADYWLAKGIPLRPLDGARGGGAAGNLALERIWNRLLGR